MTSESEPRSIGRLGWCVILLIAVLCATPLGFLCLGRYSTLTVRVPRGIRTKNLESIAGWPMVFHHTMKVDAAVLPDQPKSIEVRVLRNSNFSFMVDLGIGLGFATLVARLLKHIFTRYKFRGRVVSSLALVLVVVGGYVLLLLIVYVEYNRHIAQQDELRRQYHPRPGALEKRCRYFGEYLVSESLAKFGMETEPTQLARLTLQKEHQDHVCEVLKRTDLRTLVFSGVIIGPSELTRLKSHGRLVSLELTDCEVDGDLFKTLTQLPALTFLQIENCRFRGTGDLRLSALPHIRALSLVSELESDKLDAITVDSLPDLKLLSVQGFAMNMTASNLPRLAVLNYQKTNAKKLRDLSARPLSSHIRIENAPQLAAIEIDVAQVDSIVTQGLHSLTHMKLLGAGPHPPASPPDDAREVSLTADDMNCERFTATGLALDAAFLGSLQEMQPSAVDLLACEIAPEILLQTEPWQQIRQLSVTGPKFSGDQLSELIARFPTLTALIASCADAPLRIRFSRGGNVTVLGLIGEPKIESLGNAADLPQRIAVARHVSELFDRDTILRYAVPPSGSLRTFRMRSGQVSRAELDRLIRHPDGAYSFDLYGRAMTLEDWRGIDWGMARGIAIHGDLPGTDVRRIVTSWKPPKKCVALGLYGLPISSQHVAYLLNGRRDWRALDFGRTFVNARGLPNLSTYDSLEFLSLLRRPIEAADLQLLTQLPALRRLDLGITPLPHDVADGLVARKEVLEIAVNPYSSFWMQVKSRRDAVPGIRFVTEFSEATAYRPALNWP